MSEEFYCKDISMYFSVFRVMFSFIETNSDDDDFGAVSSG